MIGSALLREAGKAAGYCLAITTQQLEPTEDSIVVLTRYAEYERMDEAARLFRDGFAPRIMISGRDTHPTKPLDARDYGDYLVGKHGIPPKDLIFDLAATNTLESAHNVIRAAKYRNWRKILLVSAHYHLPRAYLTFIRQMEVIGYSMRIVARPAPGVKWFSAEDSGPAYTLWLKEFEKIAAYQYKGGAASWQELEEYLSAQKL